MKANLTLLCAVIALVLAIYAIDTDSRYEMTTVYLKRNGFSTPYVYRMNRHTGAMWLVDRSGKMERVSEVVTEQTYLESVSD